MLLATTDMPISDIAQETGFCAQSYFGSVFFKLVGLTPAAFRRSHHDSIGELGNSAFSRPGQGKFSPNWTWGDGS
jgi:AraC-like DNA-binding protein